MIKIKCSRLITLICASIILVFTYSSIKSKTENKRHKSQLPTKNDTLEMKFDYIINNNICSSNKIYMLILVHSAPSHVHHRDFIRSSFSNAGVNVTIKIAFLLAAREELQKHIESENLLYHDIVQGSFVDSYRNLTYKHVMGLTWTSQYCPQAEFLLKMDDDIFMDIYQLLDFMKRQMWKHDLKANIACYFQNRMPVVRDPVSKWFVPKEEFPNDTFNNYCSGWAYLTTPIVAGILSSKAKELPFFWVDDVHVTGTVAAAAGVGHARINNLFALETDGLIEWLSSGEDVRWNRVFAPSWGNFELSKKAHKKSQKCHLMHCKCCYQRKTTPVPTVKATTVKGVARLLM